VASSPLTSPAWRHAGAEQGDIARLLVVTDSPLYRKSLEAAILQSTSYGVGASACDAGEAIVHIEDVQPDAVLVDMTMADSTTLIRRVRHVAPRVKVVAVSVTPTAAAVASCVDAGASAYVARGGTERDLLAALDSLVTQDVVWPVWMNGSLARRAISESPGDQRSRSLTYREAEVLDLVERGLSNKEIASCLGIEVATVKNHLHNIRQKRVVRRRACVVVDRD
jgi:two-component system nitrate/nitrite response regulator NarL